MRPPDSLPFEDLFSSIPKVFGHPSFRDLHSADTTSEPKSARSPLDWATRGDRASSGLPPLGTSFVSANWGENTRLSVEVYLDIYAGLPV